MIRDFFHVILGTFLATVFSCSWTAFPTLSSQLHVMIAARVICCMCSDCCTFKVAPATSTTSLHHTIDIATSTSIISSYSS